MAISKKALQQWLDTLHSDADVAVSDQLKVATLVECGTRKHILVGYETELKPRKSKLIPCPVCGLPGCEVCIAMASQD